MLTSYKKNFFFKPSCPPSLDDSNNTARSIAVGRCINPSLAELLSDMMKSNSSSRGTNRKKKKKKKRKKKEIDAAADIKPLCLRRFLFPLSFSFFHRVFLSKLLHTHTHTDLNQATNWERLDGVLACNNKHCMENRTSVVVCEDTQRKREIPQQQDPLDSRR